MAREATTLDRPITKFMDVGGIVAFGMDLADSCPENIPRVKEERFWDHLGNSYGIALVVSNKSELKANDVKGHHDHRIVMALSLAGLIANGKTKITTAEAIKATYPDYVESMKSLGAKMEVS